MALTVGTIVLLVGLIYLVYYGYSVGIRRSINPREETILNTMTKSSGFQEQGIDRAIVRDIGLL
jgi:hypothetical protein